MCCHVLLCSSDLAVTSVYYILLHVTQLHLCFSVKQHTCCPCEQTTHYLSDACKDYERLRGSEEALRAEREKLQAKVLDLEEQHGKVVAERDGLAAQQAQAITGDTATAQEDAIPDWGQCTALGV